MSTHSDPDTAQGAYGRLSDGQTAASRDVSVKLGDFGVEILERGATAPRLWAYDSLETSEPMTAAAIDALLTSTTDPGMTLFVADTAFARELRTRAPKLTAKSTRWRHAGPWIGAAAAVAVATLAIYILDLSPSRAIATLMPDYARAALGKEALRSMTGNRQVCHTPAGDRALDKLSARLAKDSGGTQFKIVIVDWSLFNAFAVPGQQIVLTQGLLAKAESPDEVAGVLAHEMGHGIALDPETGFVRALGLSAIVQLVTGGSNSSLANIGVLLAQLSYSREAEHKADITALRLLKGASISPQGFGSFFKRVLEIEGKSDLSMPQILRSHPATEERQKLVAAQPDYAATPSLSEAEWSALKSICDKGGDAPESDKQNTAGQDA